VRHALHGGATLVDDSYNANPGSLNAAIELLASGGRPGWLVLGDMRELGDDARALHAEAGRRAKAAGIARLYALGPLSAATVAAFGDGAWHFDDHAALVAALRADVAGAPVVLVKGSRGSAMDKVVKALLEGEAADAA
jgi:UDP-N-acetylmuramoyl-tripeptide--D-alanyl-D-alanine ligase